MVLIIDNYDSFVYNLAQYLGELGYEPVVCRNDGITLSEIEDSHPSHIIISPGPCTPLEAGVSNDLVLNFGGRIPILGVCLGHQCIGYIYGGEITRAKKPTHGESSLIYHDGKTIYKNLPNPLRGGRYHSLEVTPNLQNPVLEISACTDDGVIMGIRHSEYMVEGVQFHPESIMTEAGHDLLRNFLSNSKPRRDGSYGNE